MKFIYIGAVVVVIAIIFGAGFIIGCQNAPAPERIVKRITISPQTEGATGAEIGEYEREIDGLVEANRCYKYDLWAAGETIASLEATNETLEAELVEENHWRSAFEGRGGGTVDFWLLTERFAVKHDPWTIPITYEFGYLKDGRPVTFINVDDPEITLSETNLYAEDLYKEPWYSKFDAGLGAGYGDGLTILGTAGWSGFNFYITKDRSGESYLFGKSIEFF